MASRVALRLARKTMTAATMSLALGYVAARFMGFKPVANNARFRVLAYLRVLLALAERRWLEVAFFALLLPKFRLGMGRADADEITPAEHLFRLIVHRRTDLRLAPKIPVGQLLHNAIFRGLWGRHLMEYEMFQTVGKEFSFYIPGSHLEYTRPATMVMFVTHPDDAEQVLCDRDTFPTRGQTGFTELVGEGLLGMASGKKHAQHRALVTKFLSDNHLKTFAVVVEEEIRVMLDKWQVNGQKSSSSAPFHRANVQYDLSLLTLDVIMRTAFGAGKEYLSQHIPQAENHLSHGLDEALKSIIIRTVIPGWGNLPLKREKQINEFMRDTKVIARKIFDDSLRRIEEGTAEQTMLSELIRMRKNNEEDAGGLTDEEIFDELLTLRGAGHETTSNTLSWAMMLLAQHPTEFRKLREEADAFIKGDVCTFDESKELKYHQAVVYETLRLFPTVPSFPRECHVDTTMKRTGFDVPRGTLVFVSQRPLNRNPEIWDHPNDFMPARFQDMPELKMSKPVGVPNGGPKYGFAPWGAANRSCVGQRLALLEAVQILSTLVKRCDWSLSCPCDPVVEVAEVTLGPKEGLMMDIRVRAE